MNPSSSALIRFWARIIPTLGRSYQERNRRLLGQEIAGRLHWSARGDGVQIKFTGRVRCGDPGAARARQPAAGR